LGRFFGGGGGGFGLVAGGAACLLYRSAMASAARSASTSWLTRMVRLIVSPFASGCRTDRRR
jgi:hypothetical protein